MSILQQTLKEVEALVESQGDLTHLSVNDFLSLLSSRAKPVQQAARAGESDLERRLWTEMAGVAVARAIMVQELAEKNKLVSDAAEAVETFGEDELEKFVQEQRENGNG